MVDNFWQQPIRMGGSMVDPLQWWNRNDTGQLQQRMKSVLPGDTGRANVASLKTGLGTPSQDTGYTLDPSGNRLTPPPLGSPQNPWETLGGDRWLDTPGAPAAAATPAAAAQPAGASPFGWTYAVPQGQYFNAWGLINNPEDGAYNYTNSGTPYNAAADTFSTTAGWGGRMSNARNTISRWTLDDMEKWKKAHGTTENPPLEVMNQLYLTNIARLRRDFQKNGQDWNTSGFAGFDSWLQGGGQAPAPAPGASAIQAGSNAAAQAAAAAAAQAGGNPVATPGNNPYPTGDPQNPGGGRGKTMPSSPGAGVFPELAITNAARDPRAAWDMFLMNQHGGKLPTSHGFFDEFVSQYLGPMVSAALNATANAAGGKMPSTIEGLFGDIGSAMGGNGLFDLFSGLAQQGIQGMAGKMGNNAAGMADLIRSMAPLTSFGMNQQGRDAFYTNQDDTLRQAMSQTYYDPFLGSNSDTDWGKYFQNTPFYKTYYPGQQ